MRHKVNTPKPYLSLFEHAIISSDDSRKMIKHFISSNQKNFYRQILDSKKYNDARFRKNPQVLYMHGDLGFLGQRSLKDDINLTIGTNTKVWVEEDGEINFLAGETQFDTGSEPAMDIYRLYSHNPPFMNAWSKFWFPIDKVEFDDEQNAYIAGGFGIHEYSAVKVGADAGAVGSDTYDNAMALVKSPMMKHSLFSSALDNTIEHDFKNSDFSEELTLLKNQIEKFPDTFSKEEVNKIIADSFTKYNSLLIPKIQELVNSNNKLIDLMQKNKINKTDIEAIVDDKIVHGIKAIMGSVS